MNLLHGIRIALNVQVGVALRRDVGVERRCKGQHFDLREREKQAAGEYITRSYKTCTLYRILGLSLKVSGKCSRCCTRNTLSDEAAREEVHTCSKNVGATSKF
jgi:hypothetical protein